MSRLLDRGRRETLLFGTVAVALVLLRTAVFTLSERIYFDSDQAIVGLMAKHLSEFRKFPFFFYGQNYMLGVEAWIIAPFFWIARPSVAVMRVPFVILNIAVALLLMRGVSTRLGLRPALGFVAALPFIIPTPVVAVSFLQVLGSTGVEPLLYFLILWVLRTRPLAFGALLGIGFLHREFTLYAIPALLVVHAADGSLWTAAAARWTGRMLSGWAAVWIALDYLRLHVERASLLLQAEMVGRHLCFQPSELADRIRYVVQTVPSALAGGSSAALYEWGLRNSAVVGSSVVGSMVYATMIWMLLRLVWTWRTKSGHQDLSFGVYLVVIGLCTLAAYSQTCNMVIGVKPLVRYVNIALVLPIGCFALYMVREPNRQLRALVAAAFVLWGTANAIDNVRVMHAAYFRPEPDPHRELTDFLLRNQFRYGRADYWDAYVVDFLSNERVIVGSLGKVRIPEYEQLVDENSDSAVYIQRMPCEGWARVAAWCVELPPRRIN